jgi:choline dehydrogenase-like flavoprotein
VSEYDAIVIGAGAAGGIVAAVLAEAGKHVLLLERGRDLSDGDISRDQLRNQRLGVYGTNAGPDPGSAHPRVAVPVKGRARTVLPHEGGYHNNAGCVGGGTRVYGAMAWRFMPQDFRMASIYGVPEGSSLADWPIDYDELEPWYDRAEREIGVAGQGGGNVHEGRRGRDYPMPAVPGNPQREALRAGADKLGVSTFTPPFLINTIKYNNRPACNAVGYSCIGFACPGDSRNGTHNTMIPRALASGRCEMRVGVVVERVETDAKGAATGVTWFLNNERRTATAKVIVVSCGAIESARLLLNSATDRHPHGLGNDHDQVGRHLQGHFYPSTFGLMSEPLYEASRCPGVSIATCDWNHGNKGIVGGAVLCNEFVKTPILYMKWSWPPDVPRWGIEAKRFARENFARTVHLTGPVQEIPSADARVTLDEKVRDAWGIPVPRLSGATHPETVRTSAFIGKRAAEWLRASGATKVWGKKIGLCLSAGQHQSGTCRMGTDPRKSVTDSHGRLHGADNLFVCDGSLHVTNGGFNPALTIMALAFRNAEHIIKSL